MYCIFQEYAKKLSKKVTVRDGMEHVPQPSDEDTQCTCSRLKKVYDIYYFGIHTPWPGPLTLSTVIP